MTADEIEELNDAITEWFDMSALGLTENDLISREVRPIIYDAEEIGTFNRLKSTFDSYYIKYLFNGMRKSNVYRHRYQNERNFKNSCMQSNSQFKQNFVHIDNWCGASQCDND